VKSSFFASIILALVCSLFLVAPGARADARHFWSIASPNHEQTFAYGSEQSRVWVERGRDRHLAVLLDFTNDPYVDDDNPRQYDSFTFAFPQVVIGRDGHTFYYHTSDGRSVPVATKESGFLGIDEIKLLPHAELVVKKPHGYLSLWLAVDDYDSTANPE